MFDAIIIIIIIICTLHSQKRRHHAATAKTNVKLWIQNPHTYNADGSSLDTSTDNVRWPNWWWSSKTFNETSRTNPIHTSIDWMAVFFSRREKKNRASPRWQSTTKCFLVSIFPKKKQNDAVAKNRTRKKNEYLHFEQHWTSSSVANHRSMLNM